jgi:hypothetical protein
MRVLEFRERKGNRRPVMEPMWLWLGWRRRAGAGGGGGVAGRRWVAGGVGGGVGGIMSQLSRTIARLHFGHSSSFDL